MWTFLTLFAGTFLSEDLACIGAGLLLRRGAVSPAAALTACALGIFFGDLGLWAVGRVVGRTILAWPSLQRRLRSVRVGAIRAWLDAHAGRSIVASRFLPGTRLPLYLIAGVSGLPGTVFAIWALLGALLWTPALVLSTAVLDDAISARLSSALGSSALTDAALALTLVVILHLGRAVGATPDLAQAD